jgi:hypothetical protein
VGNATERVDVSYFKRMRDRTVGTREPVHTDRNSRKPFAEQGLLSIRNVFLSEFEPREFNMRETLLDMLGLLTYCRIID